MEINTFKEQMASSPLLESVAGFMAWALPIGEILLSIVLFIPAWRVKGLYISGILMTLFTIYVIVILSMDSQLSCSCGGIIEDLSPRQHLLFNSACILLSVLGIFAARKDRPTNGLKWLMGTGTTCLFILVGWILFTAFTAPPGVKTGMEGRPLPSFDLLLVDSITHFNTRDIPTGKPIIFIGFSPTCAHCQNETKEITSHIDQLKGALIYFVTPVEHEMIDEYYSYFGLSKHPNIVMGFDLNNFFFPYFKATGTPYTAIYDSKKRLKEVIANRFNINELIKAVNE